MPEHAVIVRDLKFAYGNDGDVLKGISFSLCNGSLMSVIGPNGSGKSTLLRCICGFLKEFRGSVRLLEKDLNEYSRKELSRKVAVVSQEQPSGFEFTVEEVVLMGRMPYLGRFQWERDEDYERACDAMEMLEVYDLSKRSFMELSGGERQRVIIARAICQEPQILMLDEPTTFLDIRHMVKIFVLLKKFTQQKNLSAIVISQDLNLAAQFSDQVLLMNGGKAEITGSPDRIFLKHILEQVYKTRISITSNPETGAPVIIPVPEKIKENQKAQF